MFESPAAAAAASAALSEACGVFSGTVDGVSEGGTDCGAGVGADTVCIGVEGTCVGPQDGVWPETEGGTGAAAGWEFGRAVA